jgi:hypothetical protein
MTEFFKWEDYAGPQCKCSKYYLCKLHKPRNGRSSPKQVAQNTRQTKGEQA